MQGHWGEDLPSPNTPAITSRSPAANPRAPEVALSESRRARSSWQYPTNLSAESFIGALLENVRLNSTVDLSSKRSQLRPLPDEWGAISKPRSGAAAIADVEALKQAEYNSGFVLTENFGYLRRDPDLGGYEFWMRVLNNEAPANYRGLVCSFITATEYQRRFSAIISHNNSACGP
jgi:hypothetical protein